MRGALARSFAEDLAAVIGAEPARRLMAALAGREIYVPRSARGAHPISAAIGDEKAALFCDYWHGIRLEFPVGQGLRGTILDLKAQGKTHGQIAWECRVSERFVRKVLSEQRLLRNDQPRLFD